MKPRFLADYRLLFWMLVLTPLVPLMGLLSPALAPWLLPAGLYFAYCTGIASHCHNHCPVFGSRRANQAYAAWLSIFYGYPVFAWVPTHNQNHHKFTNGPGDLTRTDRYCRNNTLWAAITYPFASAAYQAPAIAAYVGAARRNNPRRFAEMVAQYVTVIGAHTAYAVAAVMVHGAAQGALIYLLCLGVPAGFAMWSMMFTNFVQHVDCEPGSLNNHSRNFVSKRLNWFVFNAGYHTVHHEQPGVHWSQYPALHRQRANAIDRALNPSSIASYVWKTYIQAGGEPGSALSADP